METITDTIVVNVVTNVVNIMAVILTVYAAMFVLKKMVYFVANMFSGVKLMDGMLKKMSGFKMRKVDKL